MQHRRFVWAFALAFGLVAGSFAFAQSGTRLFLPVVTNGGGAKPAPTTKPTSTPQPSPTPTAQPTPNGGYPSSNAAYETEVVNLVNQERVNAGCPELATNTMLVQSARRHSTDMAKNGFLEHTGSDGSLLEDRVNAAGYAWSSLAENIADGYATPAAVVKGWMESDKGHRENILDCSLRDIGVGYVVAKDGTPYWAQDFGTPR